MKKFIVSTLVIAFTAIAPCWSSNSLPLSLVGDLKSSAAQLNYLSKLQMLVVRFSKKKKQKKIVYPTLSFRPANASAFSKEATATELSVALENVRSRPSKKKIFPKLVTKLIQIDTKQPKIGLELTGVIRLTLQKYQDGKFLLKQAHITRIPLTAAARNLLPASKSARNALLRQFFRDTLTHVFKRPL